MRAALLAAALATIASSAHVNPEWGFRIERPDDGWSYFEERTAPEGGRGFSLKIYPAGTQGEILAQVVATPSPPEGGADPRRTLADSRAFVAGKPEYTEFTEIEEVVAGRAAPGFTVRYAAPQGDYRVRQLFLENAEAGIRYKLQTHAPAARFAEFEPAFRKALASFAFVPVEKPAATPIADLAARCGSELDWAASWTEASARAASERKPVVVVVRAYPGFNLSDETRTGPFMDPDVLDLVRERYVPYRFAPGDAAPFAAPDSPYGLSATTFGQAILVVSPDGLVLEETASIHDVAAHAFLLRALERHPGLAGEEVPASVTGLARAERLARRGEFAAAERLLSGDFSAAAHRLRASIFRRTRRGTDALEAIAKARAATPAGDPALADLDVEEAVVRLRLGDDAAARARLDAAPERPDALYWRGVLDLRASGATAARAAWTRLVEKHPENRWAWKAAAELASTRLAMGLSIRTEWPSEELLASIDVRDRAPLERERLADAERDGLAFLLRSQREDGSWIGPFALESEGSGVPDPLADAVTAIAGSAALRRAAVPGAREAASRALGRSLAAHERGRRPGGGAVFMDYRAWSRSFLLFFLADALEAGLGDAARVRASAAEVVADMDREKKSTGGWTYYLTGDVASGASATPDHAMSFVTAAAVLALVRARDAGVAVPDALLSGALDCLEKMRRSDGVFEYMRFADRSHLSAPTGRKGAAGRGPVCELALFEGGRSSVERVERALRSFVDDRADLEKQLGKALMHAGPEAEGCHYLLFDYAFAAAALRELPPGKRETARAAIADFVLRARRDDGSFEDTPILGPACGTGLALWALGAL